MSYSGIISSNLILLFLISVCISATIETEEADGKFAEYKMRKSLKIPRAIQRRYNEWSTSPRNTSYLYHSIPVEVTQIEESLLFMTSPYRRTNTTIMRAHLWMEFPEITIQRRPQFKKYFVDLIPVVDKRDLAEPIGCSTTTISSKVRFPQEELEMRFDITSLYKNCKEVDYSKYFKFKLRFYVPSQTTIDIDLAEEEIDIFIIFKETEDEEEFSDFLSSHASDIIRRSVNEKGVKVPQLRHMKIRRKSAKPCSVRRWVLDFQKIGWGNWVYAPIQYEINICHGRCPFPMPDHMNATNYAIVRTIASTVFQKPRGACCVAKDLAPLTMIIKDDEKATLKIQKDMVTTSCACL